MTTRETLLVIGVIILTSAFYYVGIENKKEEIIQRANELPIKECYNQHDIDIIIFNESQL